MRSLRSILMKLEHFENVKDVYEKRPNFQNLMVAKGLKYKKKHGIQEKKIEEFILICTFRFEFSPNCTDQKFKKKKKTI